MRRRSIGCAKPSRGDRFHRSVTKNTRPSAFCDENGFKNFKRPLKKRKFDVTNSIEQCLTRTGSSGSSVEISFWVRCVRACYKKKSEKKNSINVSLLTTGGRGVLEVEDG
ncbi:hypothetical protein CBL_06582 [Carabus blaptoides fortunei]